jgi:hypothetical protein
MEKRKLGKVERVMEWRAHLILGSFILVATIVVGFFITVFEAGGPPIQS